MRTSALALAAAVAAPASLAASQPEIRLIDPTDTSPDILPLDHYQDTGLRDIRHRVAVDPDGAAGSRLFLFLPGSGGLPADYRIITSHAASLGYHAIALAYPNDPAVKDLIAGETDPDLPELIRRERIFGENLTTKVDVDAPNSISGRVSALLLHLDAQHPDEGWDAFLTLDDRPRWDRVVASGHSQGAGHAAFLTKTAELAGVVMFAGPGDFVTDHGPAPWLSAPSLTPARRFLAFTHEDDFAFNAFITTQTILGLADLAPPQVVDGLGPYDVYAQSMVSTLASVDPVDAHGAVVVDLRMPFERGVPVYAAVWDALLGPFLPDPCPGDLNGDGSVDVLDFSAFAASFGRHPVPRSGGDLNRDATVDINDFAILAANFGRSCGAALPD